MTHDETRMRDDLRTIGHELRSYAYARESEPAANADAGDEHRAGNGLLEDIPGFLRKGPAPVPPLPASPFQTVEQGIYDLLHDDYGLRPSAFAARRSAPERAQRRGLFRRALERIARGLGDHDESFIGRGDVRRKGDADRIPAARFPAKITGATDVRSAGFRVEPEWTNNVYPITHIEEGRQYMDNEPRRDFAGQPDVRSGRFPPAGMDIAPVDLVDPIGDEEMDAFVARVRNVNAENERLRAGIIARDETIKQQDERIKQLEDKLRTIAQHIESVTCVTPAPTASA